MTPPSIGRATAVAAAPEQLDAELLLAIRATVAVHPIVPTISDGRPTWVREVAADAVWVETARSRELGAQHVPAWMIQIAWEYLAANGSLTNGYLLAERRLNVKRSSFVCALLATLPGVTITSRRPIDCGCPLIAAEVAVTASAASRFV